ncbi:hypothetical protein EYF80_058898 [Liparis tanakae]|uniref:Uncharacterized protein n=1 Tax=Liparis tanakae TaxID=230148 RepID=A0A4Z2ERN6_9TELE|nr:hypothetical protein EYF80_058898 [Liparis tanakae]
MAARRAPPGFGLRLKPAEGPTGRVVEERRLLLEEEEEEEEHLLALPKMNFKEKQTERRAQLLLFFFCGARGAAAGVTKSPEPKPPAAEDDVIISTSGEINPEPEECSTPSDLSLWMSTAGSVALCSRLISPQATSATSPASLGLLWTRPPRLQMLVCSSPLSRAALLALMTEASWAIRLRSARLSLRSTSSRPATFFRHSTFWKLFLKLSDRKAYRMGLAQLLA